MKIPFLSRLFQTRASPNNSFWGSAYSFFFGSSSSGKTVNERTALQTTAVYVPAIASAAKTIAFGDFSYYWVIGRRPIGVRTLTEKFAAFDQLGYLAYEFLDGKLIRPEAVKVIQISEALG